SWRSGAFPPVDGFRTGGHAVEDAGDEFGVRPPAAGEAELPEFPGGAVIVVDRLVDGVGVDLAGAVTVEGCPPMAVPLGQLRLMVGAHPFARGAPFGFGAHGRDGSVFGPGGTQARPSAVTDAARV